MTVVDEKIAFAEKHLKTKEGVKWRLKGREWIRDEFWRPADGWKLWRHDDEEPCDSCLARVGEIIDHPADNTTLKCKQRVEGRDGATRCSGLSAEPILVTVLNLERGDGKTTNLAAYSLATLYTQKNKWMSGLWASEDQGTRIFRENWETAIKQSKALNHHKRTKIHNTPPVLDALSMHSRFEVLSASFRSGTGGRRTHILFDEARDIPARTVSALLPSTNAMHGVECPAGHVQLTPEDVEAMGGEYPNECNACGRRLAPWWPRIILTSAAGIVSDDDSDFFYQLVEHLKANPHRNYHLFTSDSYAGTLNPRKSEKVTSAITEVFGVLPATRDYIAAEYGNKWTRSGEDFMNEADVRLRMDRKIRNEESVCSRRSIAFLDTSLTVEKTSLVIISEDDTVEGSGLWEYVYLSHLMFWWPGHGDHANWKRIKPEVVEEYLRNVLPFFPNLVKFVMDRKTGAPRRKKNRDIEEAWPVELYRKLKNGQEAWCRRLEPWTGTEEDGDVGWDLFRARIAEKTIALQHSQAILDEIKGVTLLVPKQGDGRPRVVDRNRRIMHKDITQSIADICYLIKKEQRFGGRGPVTKEQVAKRLATSALKGGTRRIGKMRLGPDGW